MDKYEEVIVDGKKILIATKIDPELIEKNIEVSNEKIENVVKDNVIVKEKQSIIYTLAEIKAGGYVCKSSEYSTTTNVLDYNMIKQVVSYKDIKGNVVYYKAIL